MALALRRSGPVLALLLATLLAGCDRPETTTEPPDVEMVHWDSVATEGGFIEVFRISVVRASAPWEDVRVVMGIETLDAEVHDDLGDGHVGVGDEFRVEVAASRSSLVIWLEAPDRVVGGLEFYSGAGTQQRFTP